MGIYMENIEHALFFRPMFANILQQLQMHKELVESLHKQKMILMDKHYISRCWYPKSEYEKDLSAVEEKIKRERSRIEPVQKSLEKLYDDEDQKLPPGTSYLKHFDYKRSYVLETFKLPQSLITVYFVRDTETEFGIYKYRYIHCVIRRKLVGTMVCKIEDEDPRHRGETVFLSRDEQLDLIHSGRVHCVGSPHFKRYIESRFLTEIH